jgi:ATP-dependent Lon protease
MENGARRALIPTENRRQFLEVACDMAERLDPIFSSDAPVAANKALGIT